ncbi:hypothetical protein AtNW77_Chr1g0042801 [Arabidopsis thaliana]
MPAGILAKIVSYIAEGGIGKLKNWILSGREEMVEVFSPDCLKSVSLVSAFLFFDIEEAIELAAYAKEVYPLAELLYIMLKSLAGNENHEVYSKFKKRYNY